MTDPVPQLAEADSGADLLARDEQDDADLALADERLDIDMPEAIEEEESEAAAERDEPSGDPPPAATPEHPQWRPLEQSQADRRGRRDESPEEPAPPPEDVLEETPDFLQETPEHERLWFEQRPPRDFDFDD